MRDLLNAGCPEDTAASEVSFTAACGSTEHWAAHCFTASSATSAALLWGASLRGPTLCMLPLAQQSAATCVQISHNKSLDGVLDQLNSKNVTEAGPADLLDDAASDEDEGVLPATGAGEHAMQSSRSLRPLAKTKCTAHCWCSMTCV